MAKRTHVAELADPITLVCRRDRIAAEPAAKPAGFWYEVDFDWQRWADSEEFSIGRHLFDVQIDDECRILRIASGEQLARFTESYAVPAPWSKSIVYPDWRRVAQEYDGIEIAPYLWANRFDPHWYYPWDCASGCLWEPRATRVTYMSLRANLKCEAQHGS